MLTEMPWIKYTNVCTYTFTFIIHGQYNNNSQARTPSSFQREEKSSSFSDKNSRNAGEHIMCIVERRRTIGPFRGNPVILLLQHSLRNGERGRGGGKLERKGREFGGRERWREWEMWRETQEDNCITQSEWKRLLEVAHIKGVIKINKKIENILLLWI